MESNNKKKFFYGWVITLACTMVVGASTGMFSNCNGIFVVPVTEGLGITRAAFSLYSTITGISTLFGIVIFGKLLRKYPEKIRQFMIVSAVVASCAFFSLSLCNYIWQFYALALVTGLFWPALGGLTLTTLINNWFKEKRGFALGLAFTGSGISSAIMTPIVTAVVADHGWRTGFRLLAICAATLLAIAIALIRLKPEDVGQTALGADRIASGDGTPPPAVGLTKGEAIRTPAFYLMVVGFMCVSFIGMSMSGHANANLTDIGYSRMTASSVMSVVLTIMIAGKVLLGAAFDKLGSIRSAWLVGFCISASAVALRFAGLAPFMPWVYAACFGFGFATLTVPLPYFTGEYFGTLEYASIYSSAMLLSNMASAFSQPIAGWVRDVTGSYNAIWNLDILLGLTATAALVTSATMARKADYNPEAKFSPSKTKLPL
ncbi:MAG TPA: MFS transporter [Candidatus Acidoferrum sp.]|nr:MFS transporter [Candidatus Acidoferrum sp.]